MPIVLAQVSIKQTTALPKDVVTNVFHFSTGDLEPGTLESIKTSVINVYNGVTGAVTSLASRMSSHVAGSAHEVKLYNLDEPKPRFPISTSTFTLAPDNTAAPSEVALCMSFQGAKVSGESQARKRGRVYLGPFSLGVGSMSGGRPGAQLIDAIKNSGVRLLGDSSASAFWTWIVLSEAWAGNDKRPAYPRTWVPVTNGWVDNAFDTIRSRGLAATARNTWS